MPLQTGARWSEVEQMRESQIHGTFIQFARTKSAKTRAVPIDEGLVRELLAHNHEHGVMGLHFVLH